MSGAKEEAGAASVQTLQGQGASAPLWLLRPPLPGTLQLLRGRAVRSLFECSEP